MYTVALFTIAKNLKQPKCPLAEEWGKKKKNNNNLQFNYEIMLISKKQ